MTPKPVPTLYTLPLDVHLLILAELDIGSLLCMRQVCRGFADVTQEHMVWLDMLRNMRQHRPVHLEKPLSLYSTSELEYLVVRTHVAAKQWHSPLFTPHVTELWHPSDGDNTHDTPLLLSFLPGGRWLLMMWPNGRLEFWDVQLPTPKCAQSMQMSDIPGPGGFLTNVAILHHDDSEYASFDLTYTHITSVNAESQMAYVWNHTFCSKEQNFTSYLSYSLELIGRLYGVQVGLGDKTFASATRMVMDNGRSTVVHVGKNFGQSCCDLFSFPTWEGDWLCVLQLLPEDRIACVYERRINLHQHSSCGLQEAPLLWTYEYHGCYCPAMTQPYPKPPGWRQPESLFVHFSSNYNVYRITLPSHLSGDPSVEIVANLAEKPNRFALSFGLGMGWADERSLILCNLPPSGLGSVRTLEMERPTLSTFDEQFGRVCLYYEREYPYTTPHSQIELLSFNP